MGQDTMRVLKGWNIIGSLSTTVTNESLGTRPCGILASHFWKWFPSKGYMKVDTLMRGEGYLVKVSSDGYIIFGIPGCPPGICDTTAIEYGGKIYHTVPIGNQCWLKENLDVGTMIQGVDTASDNGVIEKYCYNDDPQFCADYGGLYLWDEAMAYSISPGSAGICPPGWHLPTLDEYLTLESTVGEDQPDRYRAEKTNTSGFTAFLAGIRAQTGAFLDFGDFGNFWSSSEADIDSTFGYSFGIRWNQTGYGWDTKQYGSSIRCLQD